MAEDFLDEKNRAEDILLGSLGFGEEAAIVSIARSRPGYKGTAKWQDGEIFDFECYEDLDELQEWALKVLVDKK